jgi:hypothetical protein
MVDNRYETVAINGRPLTDPEWTNRFKFKSIVDAQGRARFGREELGEADLFLRTRAAG